MLACFFFFLFALLVAPGAFANGDDVCNANYDACIATVQETMIADAAAGQRSNQV